MKDILIIKKIERMIKQMKSVSEVNIIIKYATNAVRLMRRSKSSNLHLLLDSLPYGMRLQVIAAVYMKGDL